MPKAKLGDISIYYESHGKGVPIVFVHGFTLDRRMWRRQVAYFSGRWRVITYDSRGHGKSSCPKTGYSRAIRVDDLYKLVKNLKLKRFHLVGLSMGGATALGFAIDHPDLPLSLVLIDTTAGGYQAPKRYRDFHARAPERGVDETKRRWVKTSLFYYANRNEQLREELAEIMNDHCGNLWLDPKWGKYKDRNDLELSRKIKIPTLIFVGEKDRYFLPVAKMLHNNIESSELDVIPDVGHMVNMEVPDRFNRRLEQFLERVEAKL